MKQKIFALLAAGTMAFTAQAQTEKALLVGAGEAKEISLSDNLKVVLVQANPDDQQFFIAKDAAQKLRLVFSGNSLHIDANETLSEGTTVYLQVGDLQSLRVGENTLVTTRGVLNTPFLNLYINDGSRASLKVSGKVKAFPLGQNELLIQRKPLALKK
jgi:hypothetical protein